MGCGEFILSFSFLSPSLGQEAFFFPDIVTLWEVAILCSLSHCVLNRRDIFSEFRASDGCSMG